MKMYPFLFVLCLVGCKNAIKNEIVPSYLAVNVNSEKPIGNTNTVINSKEDLIGYWKGNLFKSEDKVLLSESIRLEPRIPKYRRGTTPQFMLLIKSITNEVVEGEIFMYGESRSVKGTLTVKNDAFQVDIVEPKSFQKALEIHLKVVLGAKSLEGTWEKVKKESYDEKNETVLEKKIFKYDPEVALDYRFINWDKYGKIKGTYEYVDSLGKTVTETYEDHGNLTITDTVFSLNPSKTVFQKDLVENLSRGDIRILKNLIYARHGFIFKDKELKKYFNSHSWYLPVSENVENDLTDVEKKNIDILQRYEKNAKEYYQVFGR